MGAWGSDTFENDDACDWVAELEESADASVVEETLSAAAGDEYLESPEASRALAACEVVARWKGNWGKRDSYTEKLDAWVLAHPRPPTEALTALALGAIDRVLGSQSELAELWDGDALREIVGAKGRVHFELTYCAAKTGGLFG